MAVKSKKIGIKKGTERLSVVVPMGYKSKLGKLAYEQDRSISAVIKRAIDQMLKEGSTNV